MILDPIEGQCLDHFVPEISAEQLFDAPEARMVGTRKYALCVHGFQGFAAGDENKACL